MRVLRDAVADDEEKERGKAQKLPVDAVPFGRSQDRSADHSHEVEHRDDRDQRGILEQADEGVDDARNNMGQRLRQDDQSHLLPGGQVRLDTGVDVEGSYWENMDRIIYNNGTIVYKGTDIIEKGEIKFGTVSDTGNIDLLPQLDDEIVTMGLLRSLNINN